MLERFKSARLKDEETPKEPDLSGKMSYRRPANYLSRLSSKLREIRREESVYNILIRVFGYDPRNTGVQSEIRRIKQEKESAEKYRDMYGK